MIKDRNCYSCDNYKNEYCSVVDMKPYYPEKGCDYFSGGKSNKESIPFLMHKELNVSISECQKAYDVAIEYLRSQGKLKG